MAYGKSSTTGTHLCNPRATEFESVHPDQQIAGVRIGPAEASEVERLLSRLDIILKSSSSRSVGVVLRFEEDQVLWMSVACHGDGTICIGAARCPHHWQATSSPGALCRPDGGVMWRHWNRTLRPSTCRLALQFRTRQGPCRSSLDLRRREPLLAGPNQ